jgi:hypothetical protein
MATFPTKFSRLLRLFEIAGAPNPRGWAQSEANENIPQLSRFLFLRQAWRSVIADNDVSWIDHEIEHARRRPGEPGTGLGPALERLLSCGCRREDLTEIARTVQWQLLHAICYQLSDPSIDEPELKNVGWALLEVDEEGNIGRVIDGLHESVLETDPTGREMRPKGVV